MTSGKTDIVEDVAVLREALHDHDSVPAGDQNERVAMREARFGSIEIERLVCSDRSLGNLDTIQVRNQHSWTLEFPSLSDLPRFDGDQRPLHVCIATEEIVGPVRNGGIGTTYAYLAEMLAAKGIKTTILYLRGQDVENGTIEHWIEHYGAKGADFVPVPNYALLERAQTGADRWLQAPYNMMRYLLEHPVDVVHVSEWRGSAYLSLLAKSQGLAFQNTLFIVKTSSPWLWNRLYGSQPVDRFEDLTKIFAERKSVELADIVIGGSRHLLRWMGSQGYQLPRDRTFVQPNVVFFKHLAEIVAQRSNQGGTRVAIEEIVFFGRLEARKGLFLFCEAIKRLLHMKVPLPGRITFMGKPGARLTARPDQDIVDYIRSEAELWPCKLSILTEFQQLDALQYLLEGARLAVMPSIIENSSLAVYEATMCGIPFVASNSGGTPELVAEEDREHVLCDAHPIPLSDKIAAALRIGGYVARPSFDNDQNLERWVDFHDQLSKGLADLLVDKTKTLAVVNSTARISACIYHAKSDEALRRTLASLQSQDFPPTEVLVALDGESRGDEKALAAEFDMPLRFYDCANFDAGLAFNLLASQTSADFLLFVWSGTELRNQALHALLGTALSSRADVLNFFHRVVTKDGSEQSGYLNAYILGSPSEAFFRSDLSPMPILVKATAFEKAEGFSTDYRVLGCEQEFTARCQMLGLHCTTALMEMGSVEAWDPAWIKEKCYDEAVSHFRAIRPQIAAAPLVLRDMMLLSKGLQAKIGIRKPPPRRSAPPKPKSKIVGDRGFSKLFALLDAPSIEKGPSRPAGGVIATTTSPPKGLVPISPDRNDPGSRLRRQFHRLEGADGDVHTGRLLGILDNMLFGWVCNETEMSESVRLDFIRDGRFLFDLRADRDLASAISLPKDLRGHAFFVKVKPSLIPGRTFGLTIRIAGTSTILADTRLGHRNLAQAGFDGHCEICRPGVLNGWAYKIDDPDGVAEVAIFVDEKFLVRVPCSREREDLKSAGIGSGCYGFEVPIPKALRDGRKRIVRAVIAESGLALKGGRLLLEGDVLKPVRSNSRLAWA